jgi:hypothetical protein
MAIGAENSQIIRIGDFLTIILRSRNEVVNLENPLSQCSGVCRTLGVATFAAKKTAPLRGPGFICGKSHLRAGHICTGSGGWAGYRSGDDPVHIEQIDRDDLIAFRSTRRMHLGRVTDALADQPTGNR